MPLFSMSIIYLADHTLIDPLFLPRNNEMVRYLEKVYTKSKNYYSRKLPFHFPCDFFIDCIKAFTYLESF